MKRQLVSITAALNVAVILLSLFVWVQFGHALTAVSVASLLAITAFSLMWVHYVSDFVKQKWYPKQTTGWQYQASRWFVLFAILTHPFLVNLHLVVEGYGLPPESYIEYFGLFSTFFIPLGYIALTLFLIYEFKDWFVRRKLGYIVEHASILAMFAVLIHGFQLGFITSITWFYWVWWLYLVTFTMLAVRFYLEYYKNVPGKKYFMIIGVLVLASIAALVGYNTLQPAQTQKVETPSSSQETPTDQKSEIKQDEISQVELATNNGKDGNKCWVAIDGEVYDASSNPQWQNGEHLPSGGRAQCGQDLTSVIGQTPHGKSVLGQLPKVGTLAQ